MGLAAPLGPKSTRPWKSGRTTLAPFFSAPFSPLPHCLLGSAAVLMLSPVCFPPQATPTSRPMAAALTRRPCESQATPTSCSNRVLGGGLCVQHCQASVWSPPGAHRCPASLAGWGSRGRASPRDIWSSVERPICLFSSVP